MQGKREDQGLEEHHAKRNRPRSKQIATDFTRVEDLGTMPAMAPFELEARRKIAEGSKTPLDGMIAEDDKNERIVDLKSGKRALNILIRDGVLTPRQKLIYELCYGKKLRQGEVMRLLGISRTTVKRLRQKVRGAFARGFANQRRGELILKKAAFHKMTRKQKKILKLRFLECLTVKEISALSAQTERSVQRLLRRTLKKIFLA